MPIRRKSELDTIDGLVMPGGESTTISRLLGVFDLYDPVAERIRDGLPVYGSCAGMILLASTVLDTRGDHDNRSDNGGTARFAAIDMTVRRNAFGRQIDSFEADLIVDALGPSPMRTVFIRAPWVESVGRAVEVLATVRALDGRNHAVAVQQESALATSFHPEMTGDMRVHRHFLDMIRDSTS